MSGTSLSIEQILTLLGAAPARIAEFTVGLTEAQLHATRNPGEWSANEVLAHLRSCADVWGNCIVTIINQDGPTIRAVNPRTWIKSIEQKFQLKPKIWSRSATVTGAGKVLERTVQSYAEWMATHERPHLKQLKRIASTIRKE